MTGGPVDDALDPRTAALLAGDAVWADPPKDLWEAVEGAIRAEEES